MHGSVCIRCNTRLIFQHFFIFHFFSLPCAPAFADFRTGTSAAFRDGGAADAGPLAALRASPCGSYVLAIFRGPAEVWGVAGGGPPVRLRQIDLHVASAAGLPAADAADAEGEAFSWGGPGAGGEAGAFGGGEESLPEQRLAFTLADGRVGVLAVRGRRVQDTKPAMPSWPTLASGGARAAQRAGHSFPAQKMGPSPAVSSCCCCAASTPACSPSPRLLCAAPSPRPRPPPPSSACRVPGRLGRGVGALRLSGRRQRGAGAVEHRHGADRGGGHGVRQDRQALPGAAAAAARGPRRLRRRARRRVKGRPAAVHN